MEATKGAGRAQTEQKFAAFQYTIRIRFVLITGFIDIVLNINSLLEWLQKSGVGEFIYRLLGGR